MPCGSRRPARAKRLIREFKAAKKAYKKQLLHRQNRLRHSFRFANTQLGHQGYQGSDQSELSDLSSLSNTASDTSSQAYEGSNGHFSSMTSGDDDDQSMPDLPPIGSDSDTDLEFSSEAGSDRSLIDEVLDFDADDELDEEGDENNSPQLPLGKWDRLRRWVLDEIRMMYEKRYEIPRDGLPWGPSYLHHVLMRLKTERADHFREALRINPTTFDALVAAIEDDPIFINHSQNPQMPVEEQLAITLYRFGHDGNASGLQSVANWAGVGKGTVSIVTKQIMTAVLRPSFMKDAVRWPTEEEKEEAKQYVEQHSCHAWRNGWCFVDGTLVPLAARPAWYGESYFDRKSRYSLNFQVSYSYFIYD